MPERETDDPAGPTRGGAARWVAAPTPAGFRAWCWCSCSWPGGAEPDGELAAESRRRRRRERSLAAPRALARLLGQCLAQPLAPGRVSELHVEFLQEAPVANPAV